MENKTVQVLMATYNGEKYIKEQIDSIINQNYSNISLLIRDDCSSDNTNNIIDEYMSQYDNIDKVEAIGNSNIGAKDSFFQLLINAKNANYYALSDQDDYWMPDKIKRAVDKIEELERINGVEVPLLYCSAKTVTDESLNDYYLEKIHNPRITFGNALVENLCTGCTCVINKKLRDMVIKELPKFTIMHDWWLYMIAVSFGYVYYDEESRIKYRQHGNNVYGEITSKTALMKYRMKELFRKRGETYKQIEEFMRIYSLNENEKKLAQILVKSKHNINYRWKILKSHQVFRQKKKDNRIVSFLIMFGKL